MAWVEVLQTAPSGNLLTRMLQEAAVYLPTNEQILLNHPLHMVLLGDTTPVLTDVVGGYHYSDLSAHILASEPITGVYSLVESGTGGARTTFFCDPITVVGVLGAVQCYAIWDETSDIFMGFNYMNTEGIGLVDIRFSGTGDSHTDFPILKAVNYWAD